MEQEQQDVYRSYLSLLQMYRSSCESILTLVKKGEGLLDSQMNHYKYFLTLLVFSLNVSFLFDLCV
jgi:hypothetical protein